MQDPVVREDSEKVELHGLGTRSPGKARRVRTVLSYSEDAVRLVVTDDGEGPAEGADAAGGGFGLRAIEERVEALGGTTAAGGRPEGGFALAIELPVRP